ncbi:MAG TPA: phosphotransferase [Dokdonella sp.]
MTPIGRDQLRELMPHAGDMCLLDEVRDYSPDHIVCTTTTHRDPRHPLRSATGLAALHLVEYAAQAMAAHGALQAGGKAQPGMLAALRNIRLHVDRADAIEGPLAITAHRRLLQTDGSLYDFEVRGAGRLLCEGRIAIASA